MPWSAAKERARIRRAIEPALAKLNMHASVLQCPECLDAMRTIDAATRPDKPKRAAKKARRA